MTQKKKKSIAENLIDSLVDEIKNDASASVKGSGEGSYSKNPSSDDDKTVPLNDDQKPGSIPTESVSHATKISFGTPKATSRHFPDAHLQQAENLKIAQMRILELEKNQDKLRVENEQYSSAAENAKNRNEELSLKVRNLEKEKINNKEHAAHEINIFRDNLQAKDYDISKLKIKIEDLESRLSADLRRIRVRERELENRLELSKHEKNALLKSKDESILDLKRKVDQLVGEVENAQSRCLELNQKLEMNQEQFSRTVRALRLALLNLESNENTSSVTLTSLKKAE